MTQNFESKNIVPSSIAQVGITTKYALLDYIRSRRFYILLSITVIIGLILTAVAAYRPEFFNTSELGFYANWWGLTASFVVVLSAISLEATRFQENSRTKQGILGFLTQLGAHPFTLGSMSSAHRVHSYTCRVHGNHDSQWCLLCFRCTVSIR